MFEGVKPIEPYLDNEDYILNTDLADYTIKYIERQKSLAPDKPFFVYYAPGKYVHLQWRLSVELITE